MSYFSQKQTNPNLLPIGKRFGFVCCGGIRGANRPPPGIGIDVFIPPETKFAHILTLTVGKSVIVRSKANHNLQTEIDLFQSCTVPASFCEYEIVNPDGGHSTVVLLRWKQG